MRVLLTRPEAQSRAFARTLDARFEVVISPLIEIAFLDVSVDFTVFDVVAFTSQNGVLAYQHLNGPSCITAYCVGDRTAGLAEEIGLKAISAGGNINDLNRLIAEITPLPSILHLSGVYTASEMQGKVTRIAAYDQVGIPLSKAARDVLSMPEDLAVPLFSPRTALLFQKELKESVNSSLHTVCLSHSIAAVLDPKKFAAIHVCEVPTAASMRDKMSEFLPVSLT